MFVGSPDPEKALPVAERLPAVIVAPDIRSAYNVGSLMRTAAAANFRGIITCGYSPRADHPKVAKTALGADKFLECKHFDDLDSALTSLKVDNYVITAIELDSNATSLWDWQPDLSRSQALVFGNEVYGLDLEDQQLKDNLDEIVEIPMLGAKKSLNIASAAAVASFELAHLFQKIR